MLDGTDGLRAPAPKIDTHVLRHMLAETSDLLDESPSYASESACSVHAAMALTRADWLLLAVHNWITARLLSDVAAQREALDRPVDVTGINYDDLSAALERFAARVDRLHARASNLEMLTCSSYEGPTDPETRAKAQVLHIFGDPVSIEPRTNAVLETRRRLNWAFGGV